MAETDPSGPPKPPKLDTKILRDKKATFHQKMAAVASVILKLRGFEYCFRRTDRSRKFTTCNCLHSIFAKTNNPVDLSCCISLAVVEFYSLEARQQQRRAADWIRYQMNDGTSSRKTFLLPLSVDERIPDNIDLTPFMDERICLSTLMGLYGFGTDKWRKFQTVAKTGVAIVHGNTGNRHACKEPGTLEDLCLYFEELKSFACPRATALVRQHCGIGLRDTNEDVLELPTTFTKRRLYARYCWERGHYVSTDGKGVVKLRLSSDGDKALGKTWTRMIGEDEDPLPVVSWSTFINTWSEQYKDLIVPRPRADICDDCFVAANSFRSFTRKRQRDEEQNGSDSSDSEDGDETGNNTADNYLERERIIAKANRHCVAAEKQRLYANSKVAEAKEDRQNGVEHRIRRYVLYGDYCQNMELPNLGSEQPGETYYMSPLSYYTFGMVDPTGTKNRLFAHVYHEGEGSKGGNNVASCLMKTLECLGLLDKEKGPAAKFTCIMDNCCGQNKNRMVLRLALLLVERCHFDEVEFAFLVKGHTKNPCDMMFNKLKKTYRKENVYTREELLDTLKQPDVDVLTIDRFYNYDEYLDELYARIRAGGVTKNHIFRVSMEEGCTVMKFFEFHGEQPETQEFQTARQLSGVERQQKLDAQPNEIAERGIRPIKQCELYNKYRSYLPDYAKDITCPRPSAEILADNKKQASAKRRKKAVEKQNTPNEFVPI